MRCLFFQSAPDSSVQPAASDALALAACCDWVRLVVFAMRRDHCVVCARSSATTVFFLSYVSVSKADVRRLFARTGIFCASIQQTLLFYSRNQLIGNGDNECVVSTINRMLINARHAVLRLALFRHLLARHTTSGKTIHTPIEREWGESVYLPP